MNIGPSSRPVAPGRQAGQVGRQRGALASAQEGTGVPSPGEEASAGKGPRTSRLRLCRPSGYVSSPQVRPAGWAGWVALGVGGGDTSGCQAAWGCQLRLEPHPEAGTSRSCLPGLAMAREGTEESVLSPWLVEAGRATQLCPEQMNRGGWEVRGQEDEAASCSEKGTCSWCGLAWRGGKAWLGR